jgi:hypothetical protein
MIKKLSSLMRSVLSIILLSIVSSTSSAATVFDSLTATWLDGSYITYIFDGTEYDPLLGIIDLTGGVTSVDVNSSGDHCAVYGWCTLNAWNAVDFSVIMDSHTTLSNVNFNTTWSYPTEFIDYGQALVAWNKFTTPGDPAPGNNFIIESNDSELYYHIAEAPSITYELHTTQVPIPAAAWLFGSALIGLVGFKRKK